jgi:hypothetical protein
MTITDVDKVANTLLYEGYLLYPYRPSALKNRQPFNFGIVAPGEEMQTECLVEGDANTTYDVRVRFLQPGPPPIERELVGATTFEWPPLSGAVTLSTTRYADGMIRLRVRIVNLSNDPTCNMAATHTILRVSGGEFLSMIDPPAIYEKLAESCQNVRTWPVLAGERGQRQTMLSSPIIVYDYPEIADESPGELYDSTEIDEILSLRILTLTDDEQREIRESDVKGRELLERTQSLAAEQMMNLHGKMRRT